MNVIERTQRTSLRVLKTVLKMVAMCIGTWAWTVVIIAYIH